MVEMMSTYLVKNRKILTWLAIAVIINLAMILFIPSHPDDFSSYHALACGYPPQHLNTFISPCNDFFHQFGPLKYQQDYQYMGVTSSLILGIFIHFVNPFVAHYLWGAIALIVFSVGLYKSFDLKKNWHLIFFYVPVTYPILHDDSSVRVSIIWFVWTPFLFKKAYQSSKFKKISILFFVSLGWLLSIEDKTFFVYLLPGLFFLTISTLAIPATRRLNWLFSRGLVFTALFMPSLFFLLFSKMGGESYLAYLIPNNPVATNGYARSIETAVLHLFSWFAFPVRSVNYNNGPGVNRPEYLQAIPWGNGFVSVLSIAVLALIVLTSARFFVRVLKSAMYEKTENIKFELVLQITAVALLFIFPVLGGAWAGHHYVFAHVAILIILLSKKDMYSRRFSEVILASFSFLVVFLTILTPPHTYNDSGSRKVIAAAISEASPNAVINCAYSCYFEYSLRNLKKIPITFATTPEQGQQLAVLAIHRGGQIFDICKDCQAADVDALLGKGAKATRVGKFDEWSLFKAALTP